MGHEVRVEWMNEVGRLRGKDGKGLGLSGDCTALGSSALLAKHYLVACIAIA